MNIFVYVRPSFVCGDLRHHWPLLLAAYGLVNANAKFQAQSDEVIMSLNTLHLVSIPQLSYSVQYGSVVLIVIKIVGDLLLTCENTLPIDFIEFFNRKLKMVTVFRAPAAMKFYGMSATQLDEFSSKIYADKKLDATESFPLSKVRRRQIDSILNRVKMSAFMSVKFSIGWLGIASSPFCVFDASHLH